MRCSIILAVLLPQLLFCCDPATLTLYVDAVGLDYTNGETLCRTIAKHPRNWSKSGDVGHAWVALCGHEGCITGGHSGELGVVQPRYCEGVMDRMAAGKRNPISYLLETQRDGFFQEGSGGHRPTFWARFVITDEEYARILRFIAHYPYEEYAVTGQQCTFFVAQIAAIAGIHLEYQVTVPVPHTIRFRNRNYQMRHDPEYAYITIGSPDILEKSLRVYVSDRHIILKPL